MNLDELHELKKEVSAIPVFTGTEGKTIALQLKRGAELKSHVSKVPAMLVCVLGTAEYEDEKDNEIRLMPGDYVIIEPLVKHWLTALGDAQLLLIK